MSSAAIALHPRYTRSESLGNEITELFGFITAATYDLLVKIRTFDQEGLWKLEGVCSCAHWLNWKCGISMTAGREKVRVANAIGDLPKISEAFRSGEISYSKVRALTRVATPENEDYLLMIAQHGTAHHVETLVRGYRRSEQLNDEDAANKPLNSRSLSYRWDEDGSLLLKGRLPAEVGAMLLKALESAIDNEAREASAAKDAGDDWEPIEQRRADALAAMAETYLEKGPAKSSSADRYQVMLHVVKGSDLFFREVTPDPGCPPSEKIDPTLLLEDGPHVPAGTSRRICCDTSVSTLVEDDKGEPLSIGRKSRVIPPAMRRALKARDKNCRFPGCTHRYRIDGHHIKHWAKGGETSLDNLVQLCRFHHTLVHDGGFGCEKDAQGDIVFRNPMGRVIDATGNNPTPLFGEVIANAKEILEDRHIDAQTCVTKWRGEKMDRDLAVANLWALRDRPESDREDSLE